MDLELDIELDIELDLELDLELGSDPALASSSSESDSECLQRCSRVFAQHNVACGFQCRRRLRPKQGGAEAPTSPEAWLMSSRS